MIFQFSILTPILLIIALVFAMAAYHLRNSWGEPMRGPVTLFMVLAAIWAFGDACIYMAADPGSQLAITTLSSIGFLGIPVTFFLIACAVSGIRWFETAQRAAILFIIPFINIILVGTNSIHGLFYSGVTEQFELGTIVWEVTYGPLYPLHTLYSYFLITCSIGILIYRYTASTPRVREQLFLFFIGIIVPLLFNLLYLFRLDPFPGIDLTPFALLITLSLIVISSNADLGLFRIVPLARKTVIESMKDGLIVLDSNNQVVDMNPAATIVVGNTFAEIEGTDGMNILRRWGITEMEHSHLIHRDDGEEIFEVRTEPFASRKGTPIGTTIFIRDISEVYRARQSLEVANKKLNLLSSITRHDILNQITAILGYGSIIQEELTGTPEIHDYMAKLTEAVRTIQRQIAFTADYENLGVKEPTWQHVETTARWAEQEIDPREITIEVKTGDLEIFADPLLLKVFSNLFHNTIIHGEKATRIEISFHQAGEYGVLTVEDDGIGIPDDMKERIFSHIRGSKMGLGLFLIREILSITGITISETGTWQKGARFEIIIPKNAYRYHP
ncbi:MAG: Sensory transduction protein kinase [Methanomicrobiales archaeon 53_19]|jgi:PAS domain S-box-containing protein|uniref:histidine kinase N-terminal 7TM domain-containing protein n=1 Tax=Methanocalculus sp. TaxID=2004547 RepID=UPI000747C62E|nr:histidine kinase N-terminal 7TM domain-containing protein [Methanocalculus sp.]KUK71326.1 MAG: Sensory transduction protein kinase [Methanocalculus sp. 52_23]KUL04899.1 MAG: Sensory transduction protein kinase [Methanomicrobiales archaeon 53_19]HIJ06148.1 PAS domain S-box protein [Methanocalculus sp.]